MYSQTITFKNLNHTFTIPELVQKACRYQSRISVRNGHGEFDAKSIMGMMALDLQDGTLKISADGTDAQEAVEDLVAFLTE